MLAIFHVRHRRVPMARMTGVLSREESDRHDRVVLRVFAGKDDVRAIHDLSSVETLA